MKIGDAKEGTEEYARAIDEFVEEFMRYVLEDDYYYVIVLIE